MPASPTTFDWDALAAEAVEAMRARLRAVLPLPGGAAGAGRRRPGGVGCNVENAAYGVALCAECGMVSQLHSPAAAG